MWPNRPALPHELTAVTTSWLPQQSSVSQAYICAPKACVWSQYKTAVLGKRLDSLQDSSNLNNWVNIRNLDLVVEDGVYSQNRAKTHSLHYCH